MGDPLGMDPRPTDDELAFYSTPGPITDIRRHEAQLDGIPDDIRAIFQVVQGVIVHDMWLGRYGVEANPGQMWSGTFIDMDRLLDRIEELSPLPLTIPRSPQERVIACCREFATLMCAILRYKGIPARGRCGFATYFADPGSYEDHWICEYWSAEECRWIMVDPQLDPFQQSVVSLSGDPLDLTDEMFVNGGRAWKMCREGLADPTRFGIGADPQVFGLETLYGLWFVRGNLLRDIASVNKVETVPYLACVARGGSWDSWRLVGARDDQLTDADYALLDEVADALCRDDGGFSRATTLFREHNGLRPPGPMIRNDALE